MQQNLRIFKPEEYITFTKQVKEGGLSHYQVLYSFNLTYENNLELILIKCDLVDSVSKLVTSKNKFALAIQPQDTIYNLKDFVDESTGMISQKIFDLLMCTKGCRLAIQQDNETVREFSMLEQSLAQTQKQPHQSQTPLRQPSIINYESSKKLEHGNHLGKQQLTTTEQTQKGIKNNQKTISKFFLSNQKPKLKKHNQISKDGVDINPQLRQEEPQKRSQSQTNEQGINQIVKEESFGKEIALDQMNQRLQVKQEASIIIVAIDETKKIGKKGQTSIATNQQALQQEQENELNYQIGKKSDENNDVQNIFQQLQALSEQTESENSESQENSKKRIRKQNYKKTDFQGKSEPTQPLVDQPVQNCPILISKSILQNSEQTDCNLLFANQSMIAQQLSKQIIYQTLEEFEQHIMIPLNAIFVQYGYKNESILHRGFNDLFLNVSCRYCTTFKLQFKFEKQTLTNEQGQKFQQISNIQFFKSRGNHHDQKKTHPKQQENSQSFSNQQIFAPGEVNETEILMKRNKRFFK